MRTIWNRLIIPKPNTPRPAQMNFASGTILETGKGLVGEQLECRNRRGFDLQDWDDPDFIELTKPDDDEDKSEGEKDNGKEPTESP